MSLESRFMSLDSTTTSLDYPYDVLKIPTMTLYFILYTNFSRPLARLEKRRR